LTSSDNFFFFFGYTTFFRYRERYWKKEYFEAVDLLKEVCEPHGLTIVQVAFNWLQFHSKMSAKRNDGKKERRDERERVRGDGSIVQIGQFIYRKLKKNLSLFLGIIIGASSLDHTVHNLEALKTGKPLPQDVLEAVDRCWDLTRESSPSYFRTKDQMMGTR